MCAISGIINLCNKNVDESVLKTMSDKMVLRGPDDFGIYVNGDVGLAHRRLSIIDVETGKQPLYIDNDNIVIVFNGEIYNFKEIRSQLMGKGCSFKTESDTEVVAQAYKTYGIDKCLEILEGMFSFAIHDKKLNKIFIARDKLGEKPLFYYKDEENFYFASELKAFNPSLKKFSIDTMALNLFMMTVYIPAPYTIYKEVRKLMQGHYLEFDADRKYVDHEYFDVIKMPLEEVSDDYETAKRKLRTMVVEAVKSRMVSDVPIGAFLSGGIDSSIVCSVMSELSKEPINTFSIGFEQKDYDETARAQLLAKKIGSNHTQFTLHYEDVLEILDDIIDYYDEPYGGGSAIPSYYVAKLASKDVKVVLTGDCADELLGGYEKYLGSYYTQKYKKLPSFIRKPFEFIISHTPVNRYTNNFLRKVKKVIKHSSDYGFNLYYDLLCAGFNDEERKSLLKKTNYADTKQYYSDQYNRIDPSLSFLQKQQLMDVSRVLEGQMFVKVDKACMHCSLENRAPFIDSHILHYALSMNDEYKIKGRNKKRILKDAFADILPHDTLKFTKRGFRVPVDYWLRNELKPELIKLCGKDFIEKQGLFNYDYIKDIMEQHFKGKENFAGKLWNIYVFQKWYCKNQS